MAVVSRIPEPLRMGTPAAAKAWIEENADFVKDALDKHKTWLEESEVEKHQLAYDGHFDSVAERDKARGDDVNHKIQASYAALVIDTLVDYMLGNPIVWTYRSEADQEDDAQEKVPEELLNSYRAEMKKLLQTEDAQRVLAELLRQGSIAGLGAVICWVDENGKIDYEEFPAQEVVPVYDTRGRLKMALRAYDVTYKEDDQDVTVKKLEVYDGRYVSYYQGDENGDNWELDEEMIGPDEANPENPIEHKAGRIPISFFVNGTPATYQKRVTKYGVSDLGNGVFSLLEEFAHVLSDKANTVDRLLDQYLKLKGVDVDENEVQLMRKARAISLKSEKSDAEFIAPSQDDKAVENYLNRLRDLIHDMTFTPKLNDISGATATEIKIKYAALTIKAGKKAIYFTQALKHFIAVLTDMLNVKRLIEAGNEAPYEVITGQATASVPLYSPDWLAFTFNYNLPQNYQEIANIVGVLAGKVPDSYLYELLWFIDDPVAALEEMKAQKEEALKANMAALGMGGEFNQTGRQQGDEDDDTDGQAD